MIKKLMFVMVSGLVLMFTSCGNQHKAQSLVKDFLDENLVDQDCSYERFSRLTPTAMISFDQMKVMRQNVSKLPYVKKNIDYNDAAYPDTLLYLDPPYYKKGQGLYMNYYNDSDHTQICDVISKVNALHWVVSYDNSAFIKDLYKDFRSQEFELNYSANNNGKGTEVMFFSDNCRLTEEMFNKIHIIDK